MALSKPWALVCPASRGIGLALTRNLLQNTKVPVVATFRKNEEDVRKQMLARLPDVGKRLTLLQVDVTEEQTIKTAAERCRELFPESSHHLHLAMAIPGILWPEKSPSQIDADKALQTFKVNVVANMLLIKHFTRFLPRKRHSFDKDQLKGLSTENATFALMSARVGSIGDNKAGGWYSYRSSKAAVTQLAKTFDLHLKVSAGEKALSVALHPGTVRTDFTEGLRDAYEKAGKVIEPDESAAALMDVFQRTHDSNRGKFLDWRGKEIPY